MIRAMLNACRPCGMPQPQKTSSTEDGWISGFRSSSSSMTKAPSSSGRSWASDPLKALPMGVRTVSTITASGICAPPSFDGVRNGMGPWVPGSL
jgi:hypothetical protein